MPPAGFRGFVRQSSASKHGFMLDKDTLPLLCDAVRTLEQGRAGRSARQTSRADAHAIARVLHAVARRLRDDYPFSDPLYAAQMQQPPHPIARLAYALALSSSPNNHAAAGGQASIAMERDAVAGIAAMIGWSDYAGHLCGGGTLANAEALWIAAQTRPGKTIVASDEAHYSHARMSGVLGLQFETVGCDRSLRVDTRALAARLARGDVGTVVATLGTTASGAVDPLPELVALRERFAFRLHVDAAYGGYFALVEDLDAATRAAFDALPAADSIVIDPHKHGLQPLGCSCVLFRDPDDARHFRHRSPCTDSHDPAAIAEGGFECSRPGAAAVALWATMRELPLVRDGEFASMLRASRAAAVALHAKLRNDARFVVTSAPDLDIVVWTVAVNDDERTSSLAREVQAECARRGLHLSLTEIARDRLAAPERLPMPESGRVVCLRAVLMKAEHLDWVDRMYGILGDAVDAVCRRNGRRAGQRGQRNARVPRAAVSPPAD